MKNIKNFENTLMLTITNTLSGKKEIFKSLTPKCVAMYICGITPYDYAHVGHGRVYVTFDVLYRLLRFLGYEIMYCRNFTDIDDKLIKRAQQEYDDKLAYKKIADKYINSFLEDVAALNCLPPTIEPRVTENIPEIISFIAAIINAGHAYVSNGDVYFDIKTFPTYAKLSKHNLEDLRAGARVEIREQKKDPLDFALWKSEKEGTFWQSPWGWGRPGWHIECSALAQKFLGTQIDIHGGGMDLIFPHHENEIAQTESLTKKPFSSYWMHNAFVRINKEKMSKSLGNFFTLRDVFKQCNPMVVRFYYLNHHYRTPLDFSFDDLKTAEKTYQRLAKFFNQHECHHSFSHEAVRSHKLIQEMLTMLCDDLNTPGMFGILFSHLDAIASDPELFCAVKQYMLEVLGLPFIPLPEKEIEITPEIQKLIDEREEARKQKDFKRADEIRAKLQQMGVTVHDQKIHKK